MAAEGRRGCGATATIELVGRVGKDDDDDDNDTAGVEVGPGGMMGDEM